MNYMFDGCLSLVSLPNISNWNIDNLKEARSMFNRCISLSLLPEISRFYKSKVNMTYICNECINALFRLIT